jgi:hypothetical protein
MMTFETSDPKLGGSFKIELLATAWILQSTSNPDEGDGGEPRPRSSLGVSSAESTLLIPQSSWKLKRTMGLFSMDPRSRKTRAERRRLAWNQIDSVIVVDRDDRIANRNGRMRAELRSLVCTILNPSRKRRAERRRLARNQIDSVVVLDCDDRIANRNGQTRAEPRRLVRTILNPSRKTRAERRRLARNQIGSVVVLDGNDTIIKQS